MEPVFGVVLTFDSKPSPKYPHGYWYANVGTGDWDADGPTPEAAMAALIAVMHEALYHEHNKVIDLQNRARRETGV